MCISRHRMISKGIIAGNGNHCTSNITVITQPIVSLIIKFYMSQLNECILYVAHDGAVSDLSSYTKFSQYKRGEMQPFKTSEQQLLQYLSCSTPQYYVAPKSKLPSASGGSTTLVSSVRGCGRPENSSGW